MRRPFLHYRAAVYGSQNKQQKRKITTRDEIFELRLTFQRSWLIEFNL